MTEMPTVLVVDDEPIVRDVVVRYLQRDGYDTLEAGDGDAARAIIESGQADLVVLDLMLPGTDGLTLTRWIREGSDLPVIMLTARGEAADRIVGLEIGADDYVTKPFSPRELAIRVRNVLKRAESPSPAPDRLEFEGLTIDGRTREVHVDGEPVRLTAKEFDLLYFLASHPREVFSRKQLMDRVWGYEAALDTGTVTVHIRRLRSKVERGSFDAPAHRDSLGRRLQVRVVIGLAVVVALATLAIGVVGAYALGKLPTVRLQLAAFGLLAVALPLTAVLLSGWVMFHMGDDVKILAVAAGAAAVSVGVALALASSITRRVESLSEASGKLA